MTEMGNLNRQVISITHLPQIASMGTHHYKMCIRDSITTYLSMKAPVFIAPAMDLDMYKHPSTQANMNTLLGYGNHIIAVSYTPLKRRPGQHCKR